MKALALSAVLMLALAPSAFARGCTKTIAPPGLSAVSEYVETIPTPCGPRPTSTVQPGGTTGSGPLSPGAVGAFARSGPAGTAVSTLVRATGAGPIVQTRRAGRHGHHHGALAAVGGSGASGSGGAGGGSPVGGILRALTGTGSGAGAGVDPALLAILIACVVAAAAFAVRRRHGAS
jgi:hypothetical protein